VQERDNATQPSIGLRYVADILPDATAFGELGRARRAELLAPLGGGRTRKDHSQRYDGGHRQQHYEFPRSPFHTLRRIPRRKSRVMLRSWSSTNP
jgi:hypothetical protein